MGNRYIMNAGRTARQGELINLGKDHPEYVALVSTVTMHPDDMAEIGVISGGRVCVSSEHGKAIFRCSAGRVPVGMVFVVYGPPTCRLMGSETDGTGMPKSKGWDVEIVALAN